MYIDLKKEDIKRGVIYISRSEVIKRAGVCRSTLCNHINADLIDAYRFQNKTFFLPDDVAEYENLASCGLLGRKLLTQSAN